MIWRSLAAALGAVAASSAALYVYSLPTFDSCDGSKIQRPFTAEDLAALRIVRTNSTVPAHKNPGIRVFPNFITDTEAEQLLAEIQVLKAKYGTNLIQPVHAAVYRWQQSFLSPAPAVNMLRVTGRPETADPSNIPPWQYGEAFDDSKLPPGLQQLVHKVRALPGLKLGRLRDVTLNYRHSHFLRLDPHIDPAADGENVFIVGLDSDTVLTLCPYNAWQLQQWLDLAWGFITLEDERELIKRQSMQSWTSQDVDVLMPKRTLVHLCGDARWKWTHGTRLGIPVQGWQGVHDWWGTSSCVVQRNPCRHSVVLAFASG